MNSLMIYDVIGDPILDWMESWLIQRRSEWSISLRTDTRTDPKRRESSIRTKTRIEDVTSVEI